MSFDDFLVDINNVVQIPLKIADSSEMRLINKMISNEQRQRLRATMTGNENNDEDDVTTDLTPIEPRDISETLPSNPTARSTYVKSLRIILLIYF